MDEEGFDPDGDNEAREWLESFQGAEDVVLSVIESTVEGSLRQARTPPGHDPAIFAARWGVECYANAVVFLASADRGMEAVIDMEPASEPIDRWAIGHTSTKCEPIPEDTTSSHAGIQQTNPKIQPGFFAVAAVKAAVKLRSLSKEPQVDDPADVVFDVPETNTFDHTDSEKHLLGRISEEDKEKARLRIAQEQEACVEFYELDDTCEAPQVVGGIQFAKQSKVRRLKSSSVAWRVADVAPPRKPKRTRRRTLAPGRSHQKQQQESAPPRPSRPCTARGALMPRSDAVRPSTPVRKSADEKRPVSATSANRGPLLEQFEPGPNVAQVTLPAPGEVAPGVVVRTGDGQEIFGRAFVRDSYVLPRQVSATTGAIKPPNGDTPSVMRPPISPPERRTPRTERNEGGGVVEKALSISRAGKHISHHRRRWGLDGHEVFDARSESDWEVVMFTTNSAELPVPLHTALVRQA